MQKAGWELTHTRLFVLELPILVLDLLALVSVLARFLCQKGGDCRVSFLDWIWNRKCGPIHLRMLCHRAPSSALILYLLRLPLFVPYLIAT